MLLVSTSCNKYLDINKDPNNATSASVELILPQALTYTAGAINSLNTMGQQIGGYAANTQSTFFGTDRGPVSKNYDSAMQSTGGGAAFNNLQPYIVLNQIIKY